MQRMSLRALEDDSTALKIQFQGPFLLKRCRGIVYGARPFCSALLITMPFAASWLFAGLIFAGTISVAF